MEKIVAIIFCIIISCMFLGCKKQDAIKFYRESQVDSFVSDVEKQNSKKTSVIIDKSGVVIYKDNTTLDTTNGEAQSFPIGPKDLEFDFKIDFLK